MATEYEKQVAFDRGLNGKSPKSGFSTRFADADEKKAHGEGKRIRKEVEFREKRRKDR